MLGHDMPPIGISMSSLTSIIKDSPPMRQNGEVTYG